MASGARASRRRSPLGSLFLAVLLGGLAAGCSGPGWRRQLAAVAGERGMESASDFPGIEHLAHTGLELDWRREGYAWGFESGLTHSQGSNAALAAGGTSRADVVEASLGVRRTFAGDEAGGARPALVPYAGAGLTWTHTSIHVDSAALGGTDAEDWDAGVYVHAGVSWYVAERFFLGLDYRRFFEDFLDYGGFDVDSDVIAFRAGFVW